MRKIDTKFGTIYIEDLEYDRHRPAWREEEDRIKVFDSNKNYMDYWTIECLEEFARSDDETLEEVYQDVIHKYEVADHLDEICPDIRFATDDLEKFILFMSVDGYLEVRESKIIDAIFDGDQEELKRFIADNEWVNKIGNHYLLIEEY